MFVESIIVLLYACLVMLIVIYVLGVLGVALPRKVMHVIWLIVVLIAVLMIVRMPLPDIGMMRISNGAMSSLT
jgi:hypothetical protein